MIRRENHYTFDFRLSDWLKLEYSEVAAEVRVKFIVDRNPFEHANNPRLTVDISDVGGVGFRITTPNTESLG